MVRKGHYMNKYGTLAQDVKFELADWALVAVAETRGEGLDCIHACVRDHGHKNEDGSEYIGWCYALPEDPNCPGCGEIMPDVIQGMYLMANMDHPSRLATGWMRQQIEREVRRQFKEFMQASFLTGDGVLTKEARRNRNE